MRTKCLHTDALMLAGAFALLFTLAGEGRGQLIRRARECLSRRPLAAEGPVVRQQRAFGVGEELTYRIKWGFVTAGSAVMSVEGLASVEGRPAYHLTSHAWSHRAVSLIFKVDDRVESWVDRHLLRSVRFEKHFREGGYRKDEVVLFDYREGVARYQDGSVVEIGSAVHDMLSSLYYLRTMEDLEVGQSVTIMSHADGKNYPLEVRVLRRERVSLDAGEFDCLVVEPLLKSSGVFRQKGRLTVWLTDDEHRLPVLMKSKVVIGSVAAELAEYRLGRIEESEAGS